MKININKKSAVKYGAIAIGLIIAYFVIKKVAKKIKDNKGLTGNFPREAELSVNTFATGYDKEGKPVNIGSSIYIRGERIKVFGMDDRGCRITRNKNANIVSYLPCKFLTYTN